jgi:hypothetical protein
MTAIAERTVSPIGAPGWRMRFGWAVTDTLTITRRNLLVWMRVPAYIVFTLVQPVIFVLMFRYVFGGAIRVSSAGGYVDFLMPGIIGQTAAFATFGTAIALAVELKKGVIDRLRSMPMARSAVLAGRLVADTLRMFVTILVLVAVGYAVLGVRADLEHAGLAAGVREQPAGDLHDRRHARAGPGRPDRGQLVEEPGLAGGHLHRVRAAGRQGVSTGELRLP